jgi:hypothetical protein
MYRDVAPGLPEALRGHGAAVALGAVNCGFFVDFFEIFA